MWRSVSFFGSGVFSRRWKTVLPLFVLLLTKKIQTTKKNNERKKKKKERRTKRRKRDKQKFKEHRERERERDHLIINTMECYFFVPTVRKIQTNAQKLNIAHDSTSKCLHLLLLLPFIHPLLDHVQPKQTL